MIFHSMAISVIFTSNQFSLRFLLTLNKRDRTANTNLPTYPQNQSDNKINTAGTNRSLNEKL